MRAKNITDMTAGSPTRHIIMFALPLLVGNLFQQFYNLIDSLVVGNYVGPNAVAAVGTCGSTNFLFFSLAAGLATGIGVIVAQYFGMGNEEGVRKAIANAGYVLVSTSIVVSGLGFIFAKEVLLLLKTPEIILPDATTYLKVSCAGLLMVSLYNGVSCILRALGDSKTPLYFLILSSVVNVILDLLFVRQFGLGVYGVALATVISQAISAVTSLVYAYLRFPYFRLTKRQLRPDYTLIHKSFQIGVPVAVQNSTIAISCMVLQGVVNSFGETVMAAYSITGRIEQIIHQPYGSLGIALTNYAGQNMGAGKIDRVKEGFRKAVIMVVVFSMAMIPVAYIFGSDIIGLFFDETVENVAEVVDIGTKAIRITSLAYFGLGMIYIPRAVLNGCGDATFAMVNGFCEVACRILYSIIFTSIAVIGFWGIWITTALTWITTGIVCVFRYRSGKWMTKGIKA